ncbi:HET-domain-containing protein [Xylariaceae sp. AK1471]|nr:HET-domain-containing protein [Xylariaceae sp. AK1471]
MNHQSRRKYSHDYCRLDDPSTDIRVLEIIDNDRDDIECKLERHHEGDYDTLSWCWGSRSDPDAEIRILHSSQFYYYPVPSNLKSALKELRRQGVFKIWIDFLCIDQGNHNEKNNQVPMMSSIYGNSRCVYVWLGPQEDDSDTAMDFIVNRVLNLRDFDDLVKDSNPRAEWKALTELIKRPWFTRRWIIQEIALAQDAFLLCGEKRIRWVDFADAISLFNEVETATKSLSEHMKGDKELKHMPDFFGHVPALSATQLVEVTNNLFWRVSKEEREAKFSLEYLISIFTAFEASEPRDTIYALLAVARDTVPKVNHDEHPVINSGAELVRDKFVKHLARRVISKPYNVNYELPLSDVYVQFTKWAIDHSDKTRALDIICRPWAPLPMDEPDEESESHWRAVFDEQESKRQEGEGKDTLPSWIPTVAGAAFARDGADRKMTRKNADTLVGLPTERNYNAAGTRYVTGALRFEKGVFDGLHYHSMFVEGFIFDKIDGLKESSQNGNIPYQWERLGRGGNPQTELSNEYVRTLVADRGPAGGNTPRYYARLIRHAYTLDVKRAVLNTEKQVHYNNRNKVVGEVLTRVRSAIWNRRMMTTTGKEKVRQVTERQEGTDRVRLGLAPQYARKHDYICILYGCSVPVVLRQFTKSDAQVEEEAQQREHEETQIKKAAELIARVWRDRARRRARAKANNSPSRKRKRRAGEDPLERRETPSRRAKTFNERTEASKTPSLYQTRASINLGMGERDTRTDAKQTLQSDPKTFYQLIGECYVDGIMNGEAISSQNKPVLFEIR